MAQDLMLRVYVGRGIENSMQKIKSFFLTLIAVGLVCCGSSENKTIVAKVNGEPITAAQLSERINRPGEKALTSDGNVPEERKINVVNNIVEEEIVLQAALKEGLLKKSERLRREIMREYFQDKLANNEPTEKELKAYYEQYKKDLDQVHFRQILVKGGTSDTALKNAKEILTKLKSQDKTVTFAQLAEKYSDDETTKSRGGDMGLVHSDQLTPEVTAALATLQKPGDVSDIVKTDAGYLLYQLVEDRRGYENNKIELQMNLAVYKKKKLTDQLLEDLHKSASVTTFPKVIAKINPSTTN